MSTTDAGGTVLGRELDELEWPYTTDTFEALGHRFALRTTDVRFGRVFDELYRACSTKGRPSTWYSVRHDGDDDAERELFVDGERIAGIGNPSWLLGYLTWHVNHQVIATGGRFVLLHAAAASLGGVAVVLPGDPEAGKTTLVAGLVRAGFAYLTDEATAIDPETLQIIPYPKPLSIDRGAWSVLADLAPASGDALARYCTDQWRIRPESFRPDAVGSPVVPKLVIFPEYRPDAATLVEPVARSEALLGLLRSTFSFHDAARRNVEVLGRTLAGARCYRLRSGYLNEACQAVTRLVVAVSQEGDRG
jgi:hypothetical protein